MRLSTHRLGQIIDRLPVRFHWTIHNVIAHPVHEILYLVGLRSLADRVHDATVPTRDDTPRSRT